MPSRLAYALPFLLTASTPARALPCTDYGEHLHKVLDDQSPGAGSGIALVGARLFYAQEGVLSVFDVSDPWTLVPVAAAAYATGRPSRPATSS